ncbi:aminotransferase [Dinoroseobacter sp. PD6]|uniref:aminotransferase n=1 Tax=Dinoroseobacter sp. PD6 TaxID=3028384 RepID=UPI00237B4216|nr:aminotransferase [Dinoroseobacter sp. PD6]MDD9715364.1 aminotransferase [Dinoroseobacter sp. PD6]
MTLPLAPAMAATPAPPVMEARRWLAAARLPAGLELLNVSQAAPVAPPPPALRAAMAAALDEDPGTHLYGPVLGLPELRAELAAQMTARYGGTVAEGQIAITSGCNQAFAAVMATLAAPGDNVILPVPWYFNHQMWLQMSGVAARALDTGDSLLPDPEAAAALIDARTRAIVLVSPNNPGGVEYPAELLAAFRDLARRRGLALILDETYRDFDSRAGAPHGLLSDPDWDETVISLYSFSKAYRLTGHRVGAVACAPDRLAQVEKFLDTVQICAPQLGQRAALWGLRHLSDWLAGERAEILARRAAMEAAFQGLRDWELLGCGAYFGYARHRLGIPSDALAERMVSEIGVLALPGTMFAPQGAARGGREMRFAFANIDADGIAALADRLNTYAPA